MNFLFTLILGLCTILVSILCLFKPKELQQFVIKYYEKNLKLNEDSYLLNWIKNPNYIINLRVVGVITFIMSIFIILGLVASLKGLSK